METELGHIKQSLAGHRLYRLIRSPDDLRSFMERHVFCVWDFMWILKSLQRDITCVRVPWTPPPDPEAARLINEIVLGEESDEIWPGKHGSHFEWYLTAMEQVGCDLVPVQSLLSALQGDVPILEAMRASGVPAAARRFVQTTIGFLDAPLHIRSAVFFHSREDLVPAMFMRAIEDLEAAGLPCKRLLDYLHRHVEVDGNSHGPLAEQLLDRLYEGNPAKRAECEEAALLALQARCDLWDAIAAHIEKTGAAEAAAFRRSSMDVRM